MHELVGGAGSVGWVSLKALLLYLTAIFGFRLTHRRTLAEMSPFDFVAAVAVGAIVGRVPNSTTTSYIEGAATLATILVAHWIITRLRRIPGIVDLIQHPPRVLAVNGQIMERELRRAGLTHSDLRGLLRQNGVRDMSEVRFAIFEERGRVSIVRQPSKPEAELDLVREVIENAAKGTAGKP
jgi:uncharacterized membrane protein YcaP (DUF421 family)